MYVFLNPFLTNVRLVQKPGSWFLLAKCLKNTYGRVTFYSQGFLVLFVFKNQLRDLSVSGTFVGNGLNISFKPFIHNSEKMVKHTLKNLAV